MCSVFTGKKIVCVKMSSARIIGIVGATSPLGVHLVDFLVEQGYEVRAGYRLHEHVPMAWWSNSSIICVKADLEDQENMKSAFEVCPVVVWLAHRQQGRNNKREIRLNTIPLDWFCRQIPQLGLQKLVFVSSGGSVYGQPIIVPVPEGHPRNPLSSYGRAKKRMEDILHLHAGQTGVAAAVLRPGNIYGPEYLSQRAKGVIGAFFRSIRNQRPFTLIGGGTVIRDFVHVHDVTRAIVCAIELEQKNIVWNIGWGTGYSVSYILELISTAMVCTKPVVIHRPAFTTDVTTSVLSTHRIIKESGWTPQINIRQGIERLADLSKMQP